MLHIVSHTDLILVILILPFYVQVDSVRLPQVSARINWHALFNKHYKVATTNESL